MKCLLLPVAVFIFSLVACTKENNFSGKLSPIEGSHSRPGLGDNPGLPTGTDWILPDKISIVPRTHHAFNSDISKLYGSANTFYTDISFVNDTTIPITVRIPSGLIFVQFVHHRMQYGISPAEITLTIPPSDGGPGPGRDTTTIYLGLACLNEKWAFPWEDYATEDVTGFPLNKGFYQPHKVTDDPNLLDLLLYLGGKPGLRLAHHYNPHEQYLPEYEPPQWKRIYERIQEMIWKVTEGEGITSKEITEFHNELDQYD